MTNSIPVIGELVSDDRVNLVAVGGAIRKQVKAMVGEFSRRAFASMNVDVLFLGASGYTIEGGGTTVSLLEAEAKQAMIASAQYVCVVVDSTKYDEVNFAKACHWEDVDELITDSAEPELVEALTQIGVKVTVAT